MPNRVSAAIQRTRTKLATLTPEQRARLNSNMDLTFHEHFEYQNQQAQAHAMGKLSADEAMIVYRALGEVGSSKNGGWASGTDLATKIVVTQLIGELLGAGRRRTRRRQSPAPKGIEAERRRRSAQSKHQARRADGRFR
jgi:hypothetical protein